jgi:VanZ family protein
MGVIFYASSLPGSDVPQGPSGLAHFALYAVLGALLALALGPGSGWRTIAVAAAIGAFYGLTDEFHQSFVPGRTPSSADWLIDVAGAASGAAIVVLSARGAARRRPRDQDSEPRAG